MEKEFSFPVPAKGSHAPQGFRFRESGAAGAGFDTVDSQAVAEHTLTLAPGMAYLPFHELILTSDIITLHRPLTPMNRHLIGGREAAIEAGIFFEDLSGQVILDDLFARLSTFPNVIITGYQGFFTQDALMDITQTTMDNLSEFERSGKCVNAVSLGAIRRWSTSSSTTPRRPACPPSRRSRCRPLHTPCRQG
jgi:lactate dehydrogenase-like 2-hydroxyacid dehydrogenase